MKKYGRSLSFCIKDILSGKVALEDVGIIVASTACESNDDWERLLNTYQSTYWRDYKLNDCRSVLWTLLDNGQIYQPRLDIGKYQSLAGVSNWCETYEEALSTLKNVNYK